MFIVGTELSSTVGHEQKWRDIIATIRGILPNTPLTYASNWGCGSASETPGPDAVKFWDALDIIGVDAYYPLATAAGSSVAQLVAAWSNSPTCGNIFGDLDSLRKQYGKPLMFTELGYTTTDKCAVGNHAGGNLDMQAQANAYEAVFQALYSQEWFMGIFFWDWETNPHQGGRCDGGPFSFTPRGKLAEDVVKKYFGPPQPTPMPPAPTPAPACSDNPPDTSYTCAQQKGWGKCGESWMQGHCCKTCFDCNGCNGVATRDSSLTIYQNGQAHWQDYTYNCQHSLKGTGQLYTGHQYSAHAKCSNWGALSFHGGSVFSGQYSALKFSIHSSALSADQVQVALYGSSDPSHPFSPLFAAFYVDSCHLDEKGWVDVSIPMLDLLPPSGNTNINRVEFKTNYATGSGEIWIDNVILQASSSMTTNSSVLI